MTGDHDVHLDEFGTSLHALKYEHEFNCKENSNFYKFNSKQRIISLVHSSILRQIWLNFVALYWGFIGSFTFFSDFQLLDLSITDET
jgi:hypothetical protein